MDANENSHGPPSKATPGDSGIIAGMEFERYPCPYQVELKGLVAAYRNAGGASITNENVFVGVGSDEAIDLLIRIFCTPTSDSIAITPPTYGMYKVSAVVNDVPIVSSPLRPNFQLNVETLLADIAKYSESAKGGGR